jgi:hypothetical protein
VICMIALTVSAIFLVLQRRSEALQAAAGPG